MEKSAVEWLYNNLKSHFEHDGDLLEVVQFSFEHAKEIEEKLQLELVNKFVFDYTYNYRGNKTLYEYIDVWYKEFKRLEEKHKNK